MALFRESTGRAVWRLALPVMAANIATPLLGLVDTAVVGHLEAAHYLGAVSVGAVIFNFVFWSFGFLRMATVGLAAQAYGAGDWAELRAVVLRAGALAAAIAAALMAFQVPIEAAALALLAPGERVAGATATYFDVRIWAAPFTLANYALLGWFLGVQRAGYTVALQAVLNGTNIVLDIAFVVGLGWGVGGVALASVLAQAAALAVGLALAAGLLRRHDPGGTWPVRAAAAPAALGRLLRLNRDLFVRTVALLAAFGWFTRQGAQQGETILAANAVLLQFLSLSSYLLDAFAHAAEALVGAAAGRADAPGLRRAAGVAGAWSLVFAALASLAFFLGGTALVHTLTDLGAVRATAATYLPYAAAMPVVAVAAYWLDGVFIGATATAAMRDAMLVSLAGYVALSLALVPVWGNHGLWWAFLAFMGGRGVTLGLRWPALRRASLPA